MRLISRTSATRILLALVFTLVIGAAFACSGPPLAVFQASATSGQAPLSISFTNQSKNADSFQWDYGDGEKQTTAKLTDAASHKYTKAGTYTVTLTAVKGTGGSATNNAATTSITVSPGPLATVTISPADATLAPQGKQAYTAQAKDEFGNVIADQKLAFKADDKAGQVDASGAFTAAKKAGTYTAAVTAEAVQGSTTKTASANVIITPGPLDHVVLNQTKATLNIGKAQPFTASAFDAFDNAIPETKISWTADSKAGTIANGTFTAGTTAGTWDKAVTVTATPSSPAASQMATASAAIVVSPDPLDSVAVSAVQVAAGGTQQLKADLKDKYGNAVTDAQLTWSVKDDNAGTSTAAGSLTAGMVAGSYANAIEVKATQGDVSKTANASLTVGPGPLSQVVVGPGQIDLGMGMTQQFVAVGADQYGNRISGLSFTWSVEAGGGSIDSKGLFTASTTPGSYSKTVKAVAKQGDVSQSATASVTVEADRIAFFSQTDNPAGDLYAMNSNGTNIVRLSKGLQDSSYRASWSPDGRRIAFDVIDTKTGDGSILVTDDKGDLSFVISGNQDSIYPAWSPDGKRIAYTAYINGHSEIFVMDVDGGNATRLTNNTAADFAPSWSPDGKQIVFVSERDGGLDQIYVMNSDGSGQRRLVSSYSIDVMPAWSPDGTRIAYQTYVGGTTYSLKIINIDGSGLRQLTPGNFSSNFPAWTADGKGILFHGYPDNTHPGIYIMSADGGTMTRISGAVAKDYAPAWAPRKKGVEINEASLIIPNAKSLRAASVQDVTANAKKAVVRIETDIAKGSGFIIDPSGIIMTANHMVTDAKTINVFLSDGTQYTATVKGRDLTRDVAVLQIKATGLPFLKLGDLSTTSLGQQVVVLGYPLGSKELTVTSGLVSSIKPDTGRNITWVQTDASINPGNSGGPILNLQGEVVGVVTMKYVQTGVENVGFAVSMNTVDIYLARLEAGETIF